MSEPVSIEDAPGAATVDEQNPWPGPEAFREADARFFYGRDRVRDALARLILQNRLVILYGRSGLGKTSLLRAGVFPKLRDALSLPIYIRLNFHASASAKTASSLRAQLKAIIEAQARQSGVDAPALDADATLWEWFYRVDAHFYNEGSRRVRPVLVFDQFEEAFTHGRATPAGVEAAERFLGELIDLLRGSVPPEVASRFEEDSSLALGFKTNRDPCGVLLALRQEFLAELLRLRPRLPTLLDARFELSGMTTEDAEKVVTGPGSHLVESGVAAYIVKFVAAARRSAEDLTTDDTTVDPAILSIFCRGLNNTRKARQMPRITAELVAGTQDAIIADFYDRGMKDLPIEVRRFIEDQLVTDSGYRNSAALDEALHTPGVTAEAIDQLVERRIVRREGAGPRARLELTHDVLADPIVKSRTLRRLREHEESVRAAEEEARRAAAEAADRERQAKELRRQRVFAVFLSAGIVILAALAFITSRARREAERARQDAERNLASAYIAQGLGLLTSGRRDQGAAYLARAVRVDPDDVSARSLVLDALMNRNWPLPEAFVRHSGSVQWVQFDPASSRFVTASRDKTARIWRVPDGTPAVAPLQHDGPVTRAIWSADGRTLLTISDDGHARLWDASNGREVRRYDHPQTKVTSAAFGPGNLVATGAADGSLRIWNGMQALPIKAHQDAIRSVAFDLKGERVVTASDDNTSAVWDMRTGRLRTRLTGHTDRAVWAQFSADGTQVTSGSRDGSILIWSASTPKPSALRHNGAVVSARYSPDGTRILAWYEDGSAVVWDARTGQELAIQFRHQDRIVAGGFSADGLRILTASLDQTARVWSAVDGSSLEEPVQTDTRLQTAALSPDGQHLVTGEEDGTAALWDVRTGAATPLGLRLPCASAWSATFTPDSSQIGVACGEDGLFIWDPTKRDPAHLAEDSHSSGFLWSQFSRDGDRLLLLGGNRATLWNRQNGIYTMAAAKFGDVKDATLSSDGRFVMTIDRDTQDLPAATVRTWDAVSGRQLGSVTHAKSIVVAQFASNTDAMVTVSADGIVKISDPQTGRGKDIVLGEAVPEDGRSLFALVNDNGDRILTMAIRAPLRLWNTESGQMVAEWSADSARFSPAGDVVSAVSFDTQGPNQQQLFDSAKGRLVATLAGAGRYIAFSRDGRRILTSDLSRFLRIWDGQTGRPQTQPSSWPPIRLSNAGSTLAFAPNGERAATVGSDSTVSVWDFPIGTHDDAPSLATALEAVVGYRVNSRGALERIDERLKALADARATSATSNTLGDRVRSWALADRRTRTIGPLTSVTIDDYINRRLAGGYGTDREDVQRLFPWHPQVTNR